MEVYRSIGVSRLVGLMAAHRRSGGLADHEPDLVAAAEADSGLKSEGSCFGPAAEPWPRWPPPPIINGN